MKTKCSILGTQIDKARNACIVLQYYKVNYDKCNRDDNNGTLPNMRGFKQAYRTIFKIYIRIGQNNHRIILHLKNTHIRNCNLVSNEILIKLLFFQSHYIISYFFFPSKYTWYTRWKMSETNFLISLLIQV